MEWVLSLVRTTVQNALSGFTGPGRSCWDRVPLVAVDGLSEDEEDNRRVTQLAKCKLTHSLTHLLAHPLTRSLTDTLTHPLAHAISLTHSLAYSLTHPLTHSPLTAYT